MQLKKRMLATMLAIIFILCPAVLLHAQDASPKTAPPIPVEVMGGNQRFTLQTLINKKFTPESKFSLLSVTSAAASYKNDLNNFDFINTSQIGYDLYKGFGITGGISMNAKTGFSPTAGIEYVYAHPNLLFVIAPTVHLSNNHNLEALTVLEYKPKFNKRWGAYSRFQALYNYNSNTKKHERSYIDLRLGLSLDAFAFGLGSNFDWYGPLKVYKDNYGIFLRYSF